MNHTSRVELWQKYYVINRNLMMIEYIDRNSRMEYKYAIKKFSHNVLISTI